MREGSSAASIWASPGEDHLSDEDGRDITANIQGFFRTLERWRQQRQALHLTVQAARSPASNLVMKYVVKNDGPGKRTERRLQARLIDIGGVAKGLGGKPCFTPAWSPNWDGTHSGPRKNRTRRKQNGQQA